MAKSLLSIKTKKKPKVSRSEAYLVNFKYLGDEPKDYKKLSDTLKAFNWYNTMCTKDDARQYLKEYFTRYNETSRVKEIGSIPDKWLPLTSAWVCRMATNNNAQLDLNAYTKVCKSITEAAAHANDKEDEDDKPVVVRPTIQQRIKDKVDDIIGDIEELIDKGENFSMYDWLQSKQIPPMHASKISAYYSPIRDELIEASEGKIEGYEKYTKKWLRDRAAFFGKIVEDAERYGNVAKKTRAVRKPRPVSVEKQLKGLKYQKDSAEFKLASVDPQKILGAQELWTFNTKYKTIMIFRALDRGGLKVKGTSIIGYDEKLSHGYKTGRKSEVIVDQVSKATKAGLKKVLDPLKPNTFNPRINENTILLKVIS